MRGGNHTAAEQTTDRRFTTEEGERVTDEEIFLTKRVVILKQNNARREGSPDAVQVSIWGSTRGVEGWKRALWLLCSGGGVRLRWRDPLYLIFGVD